MISLSLVGDKFSYAIVKDIAEPNAFEDAVKGVDAIAHTASPFHVRDHLSRTSERKTNLPHSSEAQTPTTTTSLPYKGLSVSYAPLPRRESQVLAL